MSLRHRFVSGHADGGDTTQFSPSHWGSLTTNYDESPTHYFDGGAHGSLFLRDTGAVDGSNWLAAAAGVLVCSGAAAAPTWSVSPSLTSVTLSTPLVAASGGTGQSSYTIGDLLCASGASAVSKLAAVAAGRLLVANGVGAAPVYRSELLVTASALTSSVPFTLVSASDSSFTGAGAVCFGGPFVAITPSNYVVAMKTRSLSQGGTLLIEALPGQASVWPSGDYLTCITSSGSVVFSMEGQGTLTIAAQIAAAQALLVSALDIPSTEPVTFRNASSTKTLKIDTAYDWVVGITPDYAKMTQVGVVEVSHSTVTDAAFRSFKAGTDSTYRYELDAAGRMRWSPGSGAYDVTFQRTGTAAMGLTASLAITGTLSTTDNVGVGTASPGGRFAVSGGDVLLGDGQWPTSTVGRSAQRVAMCSDAENGILIVANMVSGTGADRGGQIWLGARQTTSTANMAYSRIRGARENATSGNTSTYLGFDVNSGTEVVRIDTNGNLLVGTTTPGTSAAKVLAMFNGTEPGSSPADMVQLYSVDLSAGNATLGLRTETAVVTEAVVSDRTLTVRINGTTYKICLKV